MKRWLRMAVLLCVLCAVFSAQAEVVWRDPANTVEVRSVTLQGEEWLFLPSGANLLALHLQQEGQSSVVNWMELSAETPERRNVYTGLWNGEPLHVMVSQDLRSLHLQSSDPENQGRLWLEDSTFHERFTSAKLIVLDAEGTPSYPMNVTELRGRGNSSWRMAYRRRPYQLRLEDRTDLLQTGLRHEYSRTWVLLTNDDDPSFLRNQLGLDIAKELGMDSTSRCEHVDLYYDGDYRGIYLLAEKLEVGEHGVDVRDFDRLLEPINQKLRVTPPELLANPLHTGHEAEARDEWGSYSYVPGVYDNQDVDAGGYLLELDSSSTMSEQAWFSLPDGRYVAFKNPEYAGPAMIRHAREIFLKAYEAMLNYGVHPQTGEWLEELIDVDSFTRSHLVQEILHNSNAYYFSSTFFVIPEEETRLYAGPVWDFDHIASTPVPGLKDNNTLSHAFYRTTVFQQAAQEIWREEVEPLLSNILFGEANGRYLRPLSAYAEELRMSWQMNRYRFFGDVRNADVHFEETMNSIRDFLQEECAFLREEIAAWGAMVPTESAEILFELPYASPNTPTLCELVDEPYGSLLLKTEFTCVQPATEEEYGRWQVCFTLYPKAHCTLPETLAVSINGTPYPAEVHENAVTLVFEYEDPYYRPAVADGVDYGLVFDYEIYTDMYPELLEEEMSREDVIRHFRDEGMSVGDTANDYFDPMLIFDTIYDACEALGDDWPKYYQQYLSNYLPWSQEMGFVYEPEWIQAEE